MVASDKSGFADLRRATMPASCGQAVEVPEMMFQFTERLSMEGLLLADSDTGARATMLQVCSSLEHLCLAASSTTF